ncbi:MAG TPA: 2'-5' RNA ligase family protein [Candidatus Kapabacteria bacterium]|nr:2'-5' RNA ligase family protein [Candidatus Kapabacteria bacterium]
MSQSARPGIYFFAIVPPEPVYGNIREIQEYVEKEYRTHEAMKRPVHTTLIAPFEAPVPVERELIDFTNNFAVKEKPFEVCIDGFGEFHQTTIYVKPIESPEIMGMQKRLSKEFAKVYSRGKSRGPSYGFHPHITIAFRDLSRPMFDKAWHEFESKIFRRRFILNHICLMKYDHGWKTIQKGIFAGNPPGAEHSELSLFG